LRAEQLQRLLVDLVDLVDLDDASVSCRFETMAVSSSYLSQGPGVVSV